MAQHTPGPWLYDQDINDLEVGGEHVQALGALKVWADDGETAICQVFGIVPDESTYYAARYSETAWANARRICAAVNACAGISTEALEQGVVWQLIDACATLVDDLKDLIANSEGVTGLHRNGDVATWKELTTGGQFEGWLKSWSDAEAAIAKVRGESA